MGTFLENRLGIHVYHDIFVALISQRLSCVQNCDDQSYLHIVLRSSNI